MAVRYFSIMNIIKAAKTIIVIHLLLVSVSFSQDAAVGAEQKKMTYDEWMNLYKKSLESELLRIRLQQQGAADSANDSGNVASFKPASKTPIDSSNSKMLVTKGTSFSPSYPANTEQPYDRQVARVGSRDILLVEEYEKEEVYGKFMVGPSFVSDQNINGIGDPLAPTSSKLTFDPGVRGGFEIGGHLSRYLAIEGNFGCSYNACNQSNSDGGSLIQIPVLVGLVGEYPIVVDDGPRLIPYLGVDGGVDIAVYENLYFTPKGQSQNWSGTSAYFLPAWQVRCGVMVEFPDNWAFVFGYNYLGSWGAIGSQSNDQISLGSLGTSTIDIGLRTFF